MKIFKIFTALMLVTLSCTTSAMDSTFSSMPCGALYGLGLGVSATSVAMLMKSNGVGLRILNKYILFQEPFYPLAAAESFMSFTSIIFAPLLAALSLNELNQTLIEKGFTMPSRIVDSTISGSVYAGAIAAGIYGTYGLASCALGIRLC